MTHTHASYRPFRWSTNTTLYWTVSLISVGYAWHFLTSFGLFCFINGIKKWHYCCLINYSSFEGLLPDFWSWVGHVSYVPFFWFVFVFLIFSADDDGITWSLLFYFMRLFVKRRCDAMTFASDLFIFPCLFLRVELWLISKPRPFPLLKTEKTETLGTNVKSKSSNVRGSSSPQAAWYHQI